MSGVEVAAQTCTASVAECLECEWRGSNRADRPCTKCGGRVELRRCRKPPAAGSTVCRIHGGAAPQTKRAGRRRLVAAEAAKTLAEVVVEPVGDPLEALAELAAEARALQRHLGTLAVQRQEAGDPDSALWLEAYGLAMDRAGRFLSECTRLRLDEHRERIFAVQLAMIHEALDVMFGRAGLDDRKRELLELFLGAVAEAEARRGITTPRREGQLEPAGRNGD